MGLLKRTPTESDLSRLYWELSRIGAPSVGKKVPWPYRTGEHEYLIALGAEMLRYDARLLSIAIELLLKHWTELNPREIRVQMDRMRWPQALCVVLEFARSVATDPEFRYFADYVCRGWQRMDPTEAFFLGLERPGSRMSQRKSGRNLRAYERWGFVGTERPTADVHRKQPMGRYDSKTRHRILDDLFQGQNEVQLVDYLAAVDHSVTRQQALADLRVHPGTKLRGRGRGAWWFLGAASKH